MTGLEGLRTSVGYCPAELAWKESECGANCQFASSLWMSPLGVPDRSQRFLPPTVRECCETVKDSMWRKLLVCVLLVDEIFWSLRLFPAALPPAVREGFEGVEKRRLSGARPLSSSRSDSLSLAVGFNPRSRFWKHSRRVATIERWSRHSRNLRIRQPSLTATGKSPHTNRALKYPAKLTWPLTRRNPDLRVFHTAEAFQRCRQSSGRDGAGRSRSLYWFTSSEPRNAGLRHPQRPFSLGTSRILASPWMVRARPALFLARQANPTDGSLRIVQAQLGLARVKPSELGVGRL